MRTLATLLAALLVCGCTTHRPSQERPGTVHLFAVVKAIEPLGHTAQQAIVVDVDPRFALILHVVSASPLGGDCASEVVFAIHSPARLFAADARDVIGHQFEFAFGRSEGHAHLEVIRRIE